MSCYVVIITVAIPNKPDTENPHVDIDSTPSRRIDVEQRVFVLERCFRKISSYQYSDPHVKDKTVSGPSYL